MWLDSRTQVFIQKLLGLAGKPDLTLLGPTRKPSPSFFSKAAESG